VGGGVFGWGLGLFGFWGLGLLVGFFWCFFFGWGGGGGWLGGGGFFCFFFGWGTKLTPNRREPHGKIHVNKRELNPWGEGGGKERDERSKE